MLPLFARRELELRVALEFLVRTQDDRRIVLVVGTVGEMLCFETDGCPHGITLPVLPDEITRHPVAGIELYTGLGRIDVHHDARLGRYTLGTEGKFARVFLVQDIGVVISLAINQLYERFVDAATHLIEFAEIHGSSLHDRFLAIRYGGIVGRQIVIGIDAQQVVADIRVACPERLK